MLSKVSAAAAVVSVVLVGALGAGTAWAAAPPNDNFASGTTISSLPFSDAVDTTEATTESADREAANACGLGSAPAEMHSVWYEYTAPSDKFLSVDLSGSSYPVAMAVVTGSPGSFSPVACSFGGTNFSVSGGQSYHILLLDFDQGTGGTLQFSVSAPGEPVAKITLDPFGRFNSKTGEATVTGTAACSPGGYGSADVYLTQPVGRISTISGYGFLALDNCDGEPHQWSATVRPYNGKFAGGHANATANISSCNAVSCASDSAQQDVTLRK